MDVNEYDRNHLNKDDVTNYLQVSKDNGKMLVATDACGSGKTTAMIDWIANNPDWSVVVVAERKEQAERYRQQLLEKNVAPGEVAILNSSYPQEVKRKYEQKTGYAKRVCIITHSRLWLDPPQLWRGHRFGHGNILFIDEILLNPIRQVRVNIGFLSIMSTYAGFDITKYRNCLDKDFDPIDFREIAPTDQETILRYLNVLYTKFIDAFEQGTDIGGDILEGLCDPDVAKDHYKTPERIAYFACLVNLFDPDGQGPRCPKLANEDGVHCVTPITLGTGVSVGGLFDGTGNLFPYPRDGFTVASATVPPKSTLNVKLLPVSGSKPVHLKAVRQNPEQYYRTIQEQFSSIFSALAAKYNRLYVCTWRDKDPEPYVYHTSNINNAEIEIETIVRIKDQTTFEIEPVLKLEQFLWSLVDELQLTDRIFVSHYGLTRGSNQFRDHDCILLVGNFYYPRELYQDFSTFSKRFSIFSQTVDDSYDGNPVPIVLSHLIQECMRTQARQGYPVDCYLCLSPNDWDYGDILNGLQAFKEYGHYIDSIEESDLKGEVVASEQLVKFQYIIRDLLTRKQEARMVKLAQIYPKFLEDRKLDINTVQLSQIWRCKSGEVVNILIGRELAVWL